MGRDFKPSVSAHAVTRAVQKFLGVTVDVDEADFGNPFAMHLHLYAAGVTRAEVEDAILRPAMIDALRAGVSRIQVDGGVIIANRGLIITIHHDDLPRWRQGRRRFQNLSRKEQHRQYRRMTIKARRIPGGGVPA